MRFILILAVAAALLLSGGFAGSVDAQEPGSGSFVPPEPVPPVDADLSALPRPTVFASDASDALSKEISSLRARVEQLEQEKSAAKKPEPAAKEYEVGTDLNFKTFWKDGFTAETANKDFRVHFGGRVHTDAAWFEPDDNLENAFENQWNNGADFRRLRLRADGTMYEVLDWVVEMDFAGAVAGTTNHPVPTDAYLSITHLPTVGALDIGHFKEPFTFDDYSTPDNYTIFMERSVTDAGLGLARNMGLMLHNTACDEKVIWAAGIFRTNSDNNSGNAFDYGDGEFATTSRLLFMPYYANEGRCWFAFGGAYSHRVLDPGDAGVGGANPSRFRYASRLPLRVGSPTLVDTGNMQADDADLFNAQAALVLGPFMLQSEFIDSEVHDIRRGLIAPNLPRQVDGRFNGYYVQASYLLTGEYHPIDRALGRMSRLRPNEQFFCVSRGEEGCDGCCHGWGAWEIAARYDNLDLRDSALGAFAGTGGVPGSAAAAVANAGTLQDVTAGLNWYLSPNARIMFNYVHGFREVPGTPGQGDVDAVGARALFDF